MKLQQWKAIAVMLTAYAKAQQTMMIGGKEVEIPASFFEDKPPPIGYDSPQLGLKNVADMASNVEIEAESGLIYGEVSVKTAWEEVNGEIVYDFWWDFVPSEEYMKVQFDSTVAFGFSNNPFNRQTESYAFGRKSSNNNTLHTYTYNTLAQSLLEVADTGITSAFFTNAGTFNMFFADSQSSYLTGSTQPDDKYFRIEKETSRYDYESGRFRMYMQKTEPHVAGLGVGAKTFLGILIQTPADDIKTATEAVWATKTPSGSQPAPYDPQLEWVKLVVPEPEPVEVIVEPVPDPPVVDPEPVPEPVVIVDPPKPDPPVVDPAPEPVDPIIVVEPEEPIEEPVIQPIVEPAEEPVDEPIDEPIEEPIEDKIVDDVIIDEKPPQQDEEVIVVVTDPEDANDDDSTANESDVDPKADENSSSSGKIVIDDTTAEEQQGAGNLQEQQQEVTEVEAEKSMLDDQMVMIAGAALLGIIVLLLIIICCCCCKKNKSNSDQNGTAVGEKAQSEKQAEAQNSAMRSPKVAAEVSAEALSSGKVQNIDGNATNLQSKNQDVADQILPSSTNEGQYNTYAAMGAADVVQDSQTGLVESSSQRSRDFLSQNNRGKFSPDEEQPATVNFINREQDYRGAVELHQSSVSIAASMPDDDQGIPSVSLGQALHQNNLNGKRSFEELTNPQVVHRNLAASMTASDGVSKDQASALKGEPQGPWMANEQKNQLPPIAAKFMKQSDGKTL